MIQNNDIYDWLDPWIWNENDWKVILFERHMKIDLYNVGKWQNMYINVILLHRKIRALYEDDDDVYHCSNSWTSSWSEFFKYYGNDAIVNFRALVERQIEFRELKRMNWSSDCYYGCFLYSFAKTYSHSKVS